MVRNINDRHDGCQILLVDAHKQQRWHAGLAAFVSHCDSSRELSTLTGRLHEADRTIASYERENNRLQRERDDARRVIDNTQYQ